MAVKICKDKCWLTEDGKLVPDGDPKATRLFAIKGTAIDEKSLEGIAGADKYFEPLNVTAPEMKKPTAHTAHKK